ncbi:MAG: hypothetical protein ABI903_05270 [Actinomycetota bacterium]
MPPWTEPSNVPVRKPHWFPIDARADLVGTLSAHLEQLDEFDPDRLTLNDVIIELGVASARSQLDQVPAHLMRAAAGIPATFCQIRLSQSELGAILRTANLPMKVREALENPPPFAAGERRSINP